jgi:hypothetical protein
VQGEMCDVFQGQRAAAGFDSSRFDERRDDLVRVRVQRGFLFVDDPAADLLRRALKKTRRRLYIVCDTIKKRSIEQKMGGSLSVYVYKGGNKLFAEKAYESTSLTFDSTRIEAMKTFLKSFDGPLTSVTIRSEGGYVPDNIIKGCGAIESLLEEKLESQQGVPVLFDIVCDTKKARMPWLT